MLRFFTLVAMIFAAAPTLGAPVNADPLAQLDQPSQTVTLERAGTHMMAFYSGKGEVLDLTILITDPEGDALRTRIGLRDRQHHTLLIPSENEDATSTRIEFLRSGNRIEMVIDGDTARNRTDLAGSPAPRHF
ncbi:MAG: hypothetical protein AAF479_04180 [Pseudomonadota bacterium]